MTKQSDRIGIKIGSFLCSAVWGAGAVIFLAGLGLEGLSIYLIGLVSFLFVELLFDFFFRFFGAGPVGINFLALIIMEILFFYTIISIVVE